jgi:glycosyltransferase involved in cell wall biosynthesis
MKNVLFISYYFPPMGMGGVQRSAKFVKYLPESGWNPTVLTVRDVHYYHHDPSLSADVSRARIFRTESLDPLRLAHGLSRRRSKTLPLSTAAPSAMERFNRILSPWIFVPDSKLAWVPFAVRDGLQSTKGNPYDALFTTSPPHSAHLAGLVLKRRLRIPWIADFRDSWLMEKFDRVPTRLHRGINDWMLRAVLRHADRIVGISETIVKDLRRISGRGAEAFECIPNGYDPDDLKGVAWKPSRSFRITYCGTANPVHSPEGFLRGLQRALRLRPDMRASARVRFVGSVTGIDFKGMVEACGISGIVTETGYVVHSESIKRMMDSDLLLLLLPSDSSAGVVSGKLFEYLASGIPILGLVPDGEADRLIRSHTGGTTVSPDDPEAIAGTLIRLFDSWSRGRLKRTIGPGENVAEYDRRRQSGRLGGILDAVTR